MADKTVFICTSCGRRESRWMGRCSGCGEWNTLEETVEEKKTKGRKSAESRSRALPLDEIDSSRGTRIDTGINEVNQVLGGGLMQGSSILLGGEPGIGKSTLMLQIAASVKGLKKILYLAGEESAVQVKNRAERLKVDPKGLQILCETDPDLILTELKNEKPDLVIIDSLQTLFSPEAGRVPGSVNQLRYGAHEITAWCKETGSSVFFIAHVTKDGQIAGPKVIEHMVDTVLQFEQAENQYRILRAIKNRFGATDELGLFSMTEKGLAQVQNPSTMFLVNRGDSLPEGTAVAAVYEGSRVLLVEIQALTIPAKGGFSRVFSERLDVRRVSRIAAVLEKHNHIRLSDQDIYINIAGGLRISEVGLDLPLAAALYSARTGMALPPQTAFAGEISLAGEIRPVSHLGKRSKTAKDMGFGRFLGPEERTSGPLRLSDILQSMLGGEGRKASSSE